MYNISGVTASYHKRSTVYLIFQISISRNTKCVDEISFADLVKNGILILKQTNHVYIQKFISLLFLHEAAF